MFRSIRGLSAVAGLLLLVSTSFAAEAHSKRGVVFLNSVPVLQLKSDAHGKPHSEAAATVARTLKQVEDDAEVKTHPAGDWIKILVGSALVVEVSPEEAAEHRTSVSRLAETWAATIRDALALPPLKFSSDFERVPVGTSKLLGLVGSLAYAASVNSTNGAVVRVAKTDEGLKVDYVGIGDAQVVAMSGNSKRTLNVSVRPFAGKFPQEFVVEVTGTPATGSTVVGAIEGCIRTRLLSLPMANVNFAPIQADALGRGGAKTYTAHVHLRAPEAFDSEGEVTVKVRNLALSKMDDVALWYSNAPESVRQVGPLFSSSLKLNMPVRFLYHHIVMSSQPLILRVEAINDSDQSAKIMVTPGDTKPDKNPVRAGMTAASEFLRSWKTESGEIVEMPPHSTFPISIRRLSPKETMSGLCTLRMIEGPSEVQVRADALPPFVLQGAWYDASLSSTPWREAGTHPINDYDRALSEPSPHVYPNPYKDERIDYSIGGRFGFLLVGQKPISGEDHTNNLDGNFGVIYRIKATMKNPTQAATSVDVIFEASAGYMGGLFVIDGNIIQTPLLGPKSESRICRYRLEPGATKTVDIVTIPVSGGSYPATLFLRPVEEVASTHRGGKPHPN